MSACETDMPSQMALLRRLAAQLAAVCMVFLMTGAAFAAVPLFVSRELGHGPAVIGLLTGMSFLFAIAARLWAGGYADRRGPKRAILSGLALAALAGVFSLAAYLLRSSEALAVATLIIGRALLGGAEGIVMVSGQAWALAVAGPARSGLVIGWVGTAMFVAMAVGAPLGGALYAVGGFGALGLAMIFVPILAVLGLWRLPAAEIAGGQPMVVWHVFRRIALHCLTMALVGIGYGVIVSFSVLLCEERGWTPTWAGLTLFSVGLVVARVSAGSAPDRFGGVRTALWSLAVMVAGFAAMAFSQDRIIAFAGATVAGLGYSLVYPALAREALRRIPDRNRGSAMALYASTISLVLGLGGPFMGLMAELWTTGAVFVFAMAAALVAMVMVTQVIRKL